MADTTAAAALASSMRTNTTEITHAAHRATQPENVASNGLNIASRSIDGSKSSMQFDATGQIIPTGNSEKKGSATQSLVNLLA
ncbi:hypothetical protein [Komagataeibacter sp. FNDCR2]|uniref:hypothetical protein n=1 Tax=Komagataeibacter sp. FNDCR2 TaxID=2878682 RepID=UPI001E2A23F0|nr:hypothetical protein [Komagataeibacter sp. FNDCR2]MCE2576824.1 hypothetical protein [Komagataeibacter sp. FNDCR2]